MRNTIKLLILLLLISDSLNAQSVIQELNLLPTTIEVPAPEYNTEIKYFFKIDTVKKTLLIQDLRRSKSGNIHFYQWLYEIPLKELSTNSFQVTKDKYDSNNIKIKIKTASNSSAIISYWFQNSRVVSINCQSILVLGTWEYSESLFQTITKIISSLSIEFTDNVISSSDSETGSVKYKYNAENVSAVGAIMDDDLSIGDDYYFERSFDDNNNYMYPKLIKQIRTNLKEQNILNDYPLPAIVYANESGDIEYIMIVNKPNDKYCNIELDKLKQLKPILNKNKKAKLKYVFMVE